jgi:hypothetical protein
MLSLAPNFAAQNSDMGMSIVNLFLYAEPLQHGLGNPRARWPPAYGKTPVRVDDRLLWRDFRSRQGTMDLRFTHLRI